LSSARETETRWLCNSVDISVVAYSPESYDVNAEDEEFMLLKVVARDCWYRHSRLEKA
jgi:hypothetical protein